MKLFSFGHISTEMMNTERDAASTGSILTAFLASITTLNTSSSNTFPSLSQFFVNQSCSIRTGIAIGIGIGTGTRTVDVVFAVRQH